MEKELPKNWLSIPFSNVFDINGGTQPPKAVFIDKPKDGYVRLLQIRDFGSKPVPTYIPDTGKLMTCKKDDILIARYGASIGRIVTGMEGAYNVALAKVCIPNTINKSFVKWLLKSNLFQEPILSIQRTAQNGFNKTDLASIYIPLPPLPEQNRIVKKLDALFAQLETIKSSMAHVPLLLKDFRQQVLESAFKINSKKVELMSVCFKIQDGAHHSPKVTYSTQQTNTFPYITSKNIRNNYMKLDNVQYVDMDFHNTIYPRCTPELGDVLLTKDGANTGNVTLNELDVPFSLLSSVCLIKTNNEKLIPSYLKYYFQSNSGLSELIGEMTGTAIKRIVLKKIKATKIQQFKNN
jgi:type I restriction enzyme S subunit